MMTSKQNQQSWSMYVKPSRPEIPRQRSTSLPAGLASMNAEEAGILFSAAERATSRRRKNLSLHPSPSSGSSRTVRPGSSSCSTPNTIKRCKPTSQETIATVIVHPQEPEDYLTASQASSSTMSPSTSSVDTSNLFKALPVSPISPNRRQVTNPSLKSYADQLFQFTQNRLVTAMPQGPPAQEKRESVQTVKELIPPSLARTHSQRPSLESHFSDWSIATGNSRRDSLALSPLPALDMDTSLLSPDSFFGGGYDEVHMQNELSKGATSGYASSETYDPPQGMPPLTPPSNALHPSSHKDEFSYFANYDQYLTPDDAAEEPVPAEPPVSLAINLSPMENTVSPSPLLHPSCRRRAETMVRAPLLSNSLSGTPDTPLFARSSPATPYQVNHADVAVRIPNLG